MPLAESRLSGVRLSSLQAARAFAALMVLGFHLGLAVQSYFGSSALLLPFGHAGVEFFFVLSGFIVAAAHFGDIGRPARLGRFLWKRFVRIYPVYWLVFLAAYVGAYAIVKLPPDKLLIALLLWPSDTAPVISVAWSLQWEIVFYLLFAAAIVHPALAALGLVAVLMGLPASPLYLSLFFGGVAAALVYRHAGSLPGRPLGWLGFLLFAGACAADAISGVKSTLWIGAGASLLVLGLALAERQGRTYGGHALWQTLGDASYSIYLTHYPFISVGCKLAMAMGLSGERWALPVYALLLVGALLVGVALHRWVERPLIARLNRRWADSSGAN
jgi:exopolysaccharide production protein ExoZ